MKTKQLQRREEKDIKRLGVFLAAVVLCLYLSPSAAAQARLEKPAVGQFVVVDASDSAPYSADFPLSSLEEISREGDNLYLSFPAARLTLENFFLTKGEWRSLSFSDGKSVSGSGFNERGAFLYPLHDFFCADKNGQEKKLLLGKQTSPPVVSVELNGIWPTVKRDGQVLQGNERRAILDDLESCFSVEKIDWNCVNRVELYLRQAGDGSLRQHKGEYFFADGHTATVVNPFHVILSSELQPVPGISGRSLLKIYRQDGTLLDYAEISYQEKRENKLSSLCRHCGQEQGDRLHLLPCGHISCTIRETENHQPAGCGVFGHCAGEGAHEKCGNCCELLCSGTEHGAGVCVHVHSWKMISPFSSRCEGCGMVYNAPPRTK